MKKRIVMILTIATLAACTDDFLDTVPEDRLTAENFFTTPDDINQAVMAAYAELQGGGQYGGEFQPLLAFRADNIGVSTTSTSDADRFDIDRFTVSPVNTIVKDAYQSLYSGIARCNEAMANIPHVTFQEPALATQYQAELTFIRALSYFNLVRLWGRVPLVQKTVSPREAITIAQVEPAALYDAIEEDLQLAIQHLPLAYTGSGQGRATAGAAKALLGKVLLTQQKWSQAATLLKDVIDANGTAPYALLEAVADVFDANNEMNPEIIFAMRYTNTDFDEDHGLWYNTGTVNEPAADIVLLDAYQPQDKRLDLLQPRLTANGRYVMKKFFDDVNANGGTGIDFPVIRYADVLLMYAEALNEIQYQADGEAFNYLNKIRTRAGLAARSSTELGDQSTFRQELMLQRWLEFPFELHRWFDLVRTGEARTVIPQHVAAVKKVEAYQCVYPIPQVELDIVQNPAILHQNEGY